MTIGSEWIIFDTNIWIFGLREHSDGIHCTELLNRISQLQIHLPRQILRELQANLSDEELGGLFLLINRYPQNVQFHWNRAPQELVRKFLNLGCKLGDAAFAAHVESMGVFALISENRDFLVEIRGLPFRVLNASDALDELENQ